jgi:hypothetical protein
LRLGPLRNDDLAAGFAEKFGSGLSDRAVSEDDDGF